MSHYTTLDTQIVSLPHLVQALEAMGLTDIEVHDMPQELVGVEGFGRGISAEVIIRRHNVGIASNDLGFQRQPDGRFQAIISDWDRRHYDDEWLQTLTQRYAYFATRDALTEQHFEVAQEEMDTNDTIHMVLRRMT